MEYFTTTASTLPPHISANPDYRTVKGSYQAPYYNHPRVPDSPTDRDIDGEIETLRSVLTASHYDVKYIRPIFAFIDWPHPSIRSAVDTYRARKGKTGGEALTAEEEAELSSICQQVVEELSILRSLGVDESNQPSTRLALLHDYEVKLGGYGPLSWRRTIHPFWTNNGGFKSEDKQEDDAAALGRNSQGTEDA